MGRREPEYSTPRDTLGFSLLRYDNYDSCPSHAVRYISQPLNCLMELRRGPLLVTDCLLLPAAKIKQYHATDAYHLPLCDWHVAWVVQPLANQSEFFCLRLAFSSLLPSPRNKKFAK